ncbi:unnamed protein product [Owenia fusiformis]|uniref:Uncharacterized protein n=1 Tax=Owenia fusiformis TaxID=6347 RepID=A0A8S4QAC5_OWEFU|nr:unnamed protein product [Owenia fusiformis]
MAFRNIPPNGSRSSSAPSELRTTSDIRSLDFTGAPFQASESSQYTTDEFTSGSTNISGVFTSTGSGEVFYDDSSEFSESVHSRHYTASESSMDDSSNHNQDKLSDVISQILSQGDSVTDSNATRITSSSSTTTATKHCMEYVETTYSTTSHEQTTVSGLPSEFTHYVEESEDLSPESLTSHELIQTSIDPNALPTSPVHPSREAFLSYAVEGVMDTIDEESRSQYTTTTTHTTSSTRTIDTSSTLQSSDTRTIQVEGDHTVELYLDIDNAETIPIGGTTSLNQDSLSSSDELMDGNVKYHVEVEINRSPVKRNISDVESDYSSDQIDSVSVTDLDSQQSFTSAIYKNLEGVREPHEIVFTVPKPGLTKTDLEIERKRRKEEVLIIHETHNTFTEEEKLESHKKSELIFEVPKVCKLPKKFTTAKSVSIPERRKYHVINEFVTEVVSEIVPISSSVIGNEIATQTSPKALQSQGVGVFMYPAQNTSQTQTRVNQSSVGIHTLIENERYDCGTSMPTVNLGVSSTQTPHIVQNDSETQSEVYEPEIVSIEQEFIQHAPPPKYVDVSELAVQTEINQESKSVGVCPDSYASFSQTVNVSQSSLGVQYENGYTTDQETYTDYVDGSQIATQTIQIERSTSQTQSDSKDTNVTYTQTSVNRSSFGVQKDTDTETRSTSPVASEVSESVTQTLIIEQASKGVEVYPKIAETSVSMTQTTEVGKSSFGSQIEPESSEISTSTTAIEQNVTTTQTTSVLHTSSESQYEALEQSIGHTQTFTAEYDESYTQMEPMIYEDRSASPMQVELGTITTQTLSVEQQSVGVGIQPPDTIMAHSQTHIIELASTGVQETPESFSQETSTESVELSKSSTQTPILEQSTSETQSDVTETNFGTTQTSVDQKSKGIQMQSETDHRSTSPILVEGNEIQTQTFIEQNSIGVEIIPDVPEMSVGNTQTFIQQSSFGAQMYPESIDRSTTTIQPEQAPLATQTPSVAHFNSETQYEAMELKVGQSQTRIVEYDSSFTQAVEMMTDRGVSPVEPDLWDCMTQTTIEQESIGVGISPPETMVSHSQTTIVQHASFGVQETPVSADQMTSTETVECLLSSTQTPVVVQNTSETQYEGVETSAGHTQTVIKEFDDSVTQMDPVLYQDRSASPVPIESGSIETQTLIEQQSIGVGNQPPDTIIGQSQTPIVAQASYGVQESPDLNDQETSTVYVEYSKSSTQTPVLEQTTTETQSEITETKLGTTQTVVDQSSVASQMVTETEQRASSPIPVVSSDTVTQTYVECHSVGVDASPEPIDVYAANTQTFIEQTSFGAQMYPESYDMGTGTIQPDFGPMSTQTPSVAQFNSETQYEALEMKVSHSQTLIKEYDETSTQAVEMMFDRGASPLPLYVEEGSTQTSTDQQSVGVGNTYPDMLVGASQTPTVRKVSCGIQEAPGQFHQTTETEITEVALSATQTPIVQLSNSESQSDVTETLPGMTQTFLDQSNSSVQAVESVTERSVSPIPLDVYECDTQTEIKEYSSVGVDHVPESAVAFSQTSVDQRDSSVQNTAELVDQEMSTIMLEFSRGSTQTATVELASSETQSENVELQHGVSQTVIEQGTIGIQMSQVTESRGMSPIPQDVEEIQTQTNYVKVESTGMVTDLTDTSVIETQTTAVDVTSSGIQYESDVKECGVATDTVEYAKNTTQTTIVELRSTEMQSDIAEMSIAQSQTFIEQSTTGTQMAIGYREMAASPIPIDTGVVQTQTFIEQDSVACEAIPEPVPVQTEVTQTFIEQTSFGAQIYPESYEAYTSTDQVEQGISQTQTPVIYQSTSNTQYEWETFVCGTQTSVDQGTVGIQFEPVTTDRGSSPVKFIGEDVVTQTPTTEQASKGVYVVPEIPEAFTTETQTSIDLTTTGSQMEPVHRGVVQTQTYIEQYSIGSQMISETKEQHTTTDVSQAVTSTQTSIPQSTTGTGDSIATTSEVVSQTYVDLYDVGTQIIFNSREMGTETDPEPEIIQEVIVPTQAPQVEFENYPRFEVHEEMTYFDEAQTQTAVSQSSIGVEAIAESYEYFTQTPVTTQHTSDTQCEPLEAYSFGTQTIQPLMRTVRTGEDHAVTSTEQTQTNVEQSEIDTQTAQSSGDTRETQTHIKQRTIQMQTGFDQRNVAISTNLQPTRAIIPTQTEVQDMVKDESYEQQTTKVRRDTTDYGIVEDRYITEYEKITEYDTLAQARERQLDLILKNKGEIVDKEYEAEDTTAIVETSELNLILNNEDKQQREVYRNEEEDYTTLTEEEYLQVIPDEPSEPQIIAVYTTKSVTSLESRQIDVFEEGVIQEPNVTVMGNVSLDTSQSRPSSVHSEKAVITVDLSNPYKGESDTVGIQRKQDNQMATVLHIDHDNVEVTEQMTAPKCYILEFPTDEKQQKEIRAKSPMPLREIRRQQTRTPSDSYRASGSDYDDVNEISFGTKNTQRNRRSYASNRASGNDYDDVHEITTNRIDHDYKNSESYTKSVNRVSTDYTTIDHFITDRHDSVSSTYSSLHKPRSDSRPSSSSSLHATQVTINPGSSLSPVPTGQVSKAKVVSVTTETVPGGQTQYIDVISQDQVSTDMHSYSEHVSKSSYNSSVVQQTNTQNDQTHVYATQTAPKTISINFEKFNTQDDYESLDRTNVRENKGRESPNVVRISQSPSFNVQRVTHREDSSEYETPFQGNVPMVSPSVTLTGQKHGRIDSGDYEIPSYTTQRSEHISGVQSQEIPIQINLQTETKSTEPKFTIQNTSWDTVVPVRSADMNVARVSPHVQMTHQFQNTVTEPTGYEVPVVNIRNESHVINHSTQSTHTETHSSPGYEVPIVLNIKREGNPTDDNTVHESAYTTIVHGEHSQQEIPIQVNLRNETSFHDPTFTIKETKSHFTSTTSNTHEIPVQTTALEQGVQPTFTIHRIETDTLSSRGSQDNQEPALPVSQLGRDSISQSSIRNNEAHVSSSSSGSAFTVHKVNTTTDQDSSIDTPPPVINLATFPRDVERSNVTVDVIDGGQSASVGGFKPRSSVSLQKFQSVDPDTGAHTSGYVREEQHHSEYTSERPIEMDYQLRGPGDFGRHMASGQMIGSDHVSTSTSSYSSMRKNVIQSSSVVSRVERPLSRSSVISSEGSLAGESTLVDGKKIWRIDL